MQGLRRVSLIELATGHLRKGLQDGRWSGSLPGVVRLAQELDVSRHTLRAALRRLEAEGLLSGRGLGRSRSITAVASDVVLRHSLRVAILRHDAQLADNPQTALVLTEIMHSLEADGHEVLLVGKSQLELKHDVRRVAREMARTPADAWVIEAGSRPLLEWCSTLPTPCLALYGSTGTLPLASVGPDLIPAYHAATRHLIGLGHRRIVFIVSEARRKPTLGTSARAFLEDLNAHGIPTSGYNLPDWEETPKGFTRLLESLFRRTPPTALMIDETPRFFAAVAFLARHGIRVPGQVSLVSTDCDDTLGWCYPGFAHMRWDNRLIVRRVVRWVAAVRKGKPDRKTINFPAEFIPGGSIGAASKSS
jgi:DNA-binding LacI/PurR family transcriptional regulator